MKRLFVYILFSVFFLCLFVPQLSAQTRQQDLELTVIAPINTPEGERVISLDRYRRFHVLLTNISARSIRLWQSWNSWGYQNMTLITNFGDGWATIRRQKPKHIDGDFPDFWVLEPGEYLVLEVDLSTAEWKGIPDLYDESQNAKMKVMFQSPRDVLSEEFGIWTGNIESEEVKVVFK